MLGGLSRLRDAGFSPTGILDVGAYEGGFARTARQIWPDAYILMIDALSEKSPMLAQTCRDLSNADHTIALLGARDMPAASFFVVDTDRRPDLIKSGSSKFRENTGFPMQERQLPQDTLDRVVSDYDYGRSFQFLKLDVQGAELEVLRGFAHHLPSIEVILMELSLVEYNQGAPLIDTVLRELSGMDFVLYDIIDKHRHRGGLWQLDGLFVRARSQFRPKAPFWS